jgi:hypothetical protein
MVRVWCKIADYSISKLAVIANFTEGTLEAYVYLGMLKSLPRFFT